jgi:hypothetical protein
MLAATWSATSRCPHAGSDGEGCRFVVPVLSFRRSASRKRSDHPRPLCAAERRSEQTATRATDSGPPRDALEIAKGMVLARESLAPQRSREGASARAVTLSGPLVFAPSSVRPSMATNVYVDAFNVFSGGLKGTPYRWHDLGARCARLRRGRWAYATPVAAATNASEGILRRNMTYIVPPVWTACLRERFAGSGFVDVIEADVLGDVTCCSDRLKPSSAVPSLLFRAFASSGLPPCRLFDRSRQPGIARPQASGSGTGPAYRRRKLGPSGRGGNGQRR